MRVEIEEAKATMKKGAPVVASRAVDLTLDDLNDIRKAWAVQPSGQVGASRRFHSMRH